MWILYRSIYLLYIYEYNFCDGFTHWHMHKSVASLQVFCLILDLSTWPKQRMDKEILFSSIKILTSINDVLILGDMDKNYNGKHFVKISFLMHILHQFGFFTNPLAQHVYVSLVAIKFLWLGPFISLWFHYNSFFVNIFISVWFSKHLLS